jgi:hypothetical protein
MNFFALAATSAPNVLKRTAMCAMDMANANITGAFQSVEKN